MKLLSTSCLLLIRSSNAFTSPNKASTVRNFSKTAVKMTEKPFSIIVEAEIKEDRMDEFLTMIENNAKKSREEPGCIRFGMAIQFCCNIKCQSPLLRLIFFVLFDVFHF
jgi:hypothetical protein